jgi:hypothetical protein
VIYRLLSVEFVSSCHCYGRMVMSRVLLDPFTALRGIPSAS